jgi:ABC-type uncharacterized transport system involved in gliding motility auxiliary subunit
MQKFFVLCIISLMLLMRGDSRSVFLMVSARTAYITSPLDESEGIDRNNIGIEEVGDLDSSSSNFENQQQDEAVDADACSLVNNKSIHGELVIP